jgi:hypothetical protein
MSSITSADVPPLVSYTPEILTVPSVYASAVVA